MKVFKYFLINGAFAAALYFGLYVGIEGAQNIVLLISWAMIAMSPLAIFDPVIEAAAEKKYKPSIPEWVDVSLDVAIVIVLAWFGWMWTASFYFIHIFFMASFKMRVKEKTAEMEAEADGLD